MTNLSLTIITLKFALLVLNISFSLLTRLFEAFVLTENQEINTKEKNPEIPGNFTHF